MVVEHGGMVVDGVQRGSTLQCPHCGCHFESVAGSGKRRTFCLHCMAVTCGGRGCDACIPVEARLENAEGRRTRYDEEIRKLTGQGGVLL